MKLAYLRTSSIDQNLARQQYLSDEADKTFSEQVSGKDTNRPELQRMLGELRAGDTVIVHDISRLARSLGDLNNLIQEINGKGAAVEFKKEGLVFTADKSSPTNELMLNVLGAIYQFERAISKERQAEGIAKAKAEGRMNGRPKNVRQQSDIKKHLLEGVSIRKTAELVGCGVSTVQRVKKVMV
ncbi:recombinase family protein [Vibrio paucivorans]|uniref:Recombinase family protein n=1 Tax=Vibrio paucivorans TaxID=2829489 RepID=A0A9X3CKH0_9VIBR|nr:recombinase family protein [Vibrio paucivorans]MCW8336470.1 recombinase family protein [Vibrio paucivorans]